MGVSIKMEFLSKKQKHKNTHQTSHFLEKKKKRGKKKKERKGMKDRKERKERELSPRLKEKTQQHEIWKGKQENTQQRHSKSTKAAAKKQFNFIDVTRCTAAIMGHSHTRRLMRTMC